MKLTILAAILLAISGLTFGQDGTRPLKTSTNNPDVRPTRINEDTLASHGFTLDGGLPKCTIKGPDGPCRVASFIGGETLDDDAAYTCSKLDRATYIGHCAGGKLEGFSILIADGSKKQSREAFVSYFLDGKIAYPALTSQLTDELNFGVREQMSSYGCVYFGRWDKSVERCARLISIYGKDIFSEANAQKLRDGTFDVDRYGAKFLEFMGRK